ncbi:MAG: TlpA family protein disulfide reductase [Methylococcaceae bacterium]
MRTNLLIIIIAVLSLLTGIIVRQSLLGVGSQRNSANPAFVTDHPPLRDLDGEMVSLKHWKGSKLLINFWASWCGPCREEMPLFSALQNNWRENSLQVIGIAIDDPLEVSSYLEETPVSYPILISSIESSEWMRSLGNQANVLPFTVLLDEQGKLLATFVGKLNKTTLEEWMRPHLSGLKLVDPSLNNTRISTLTGTKK